MLKPFVIEFGFRGFEPEEDIRLRRAWLDNEKQVEKAVYDMSREENIHVVWYKVYKVTEIGV